MDSLPGEHYATLGVSQDASQDEIKKAYRSLALRWHPDRNPENQEEAEKMFKRVAEAYATLRDEQKRREYDKEGQESHAPQARHAGFDRDRAQDLFADFFGPGGVHDLYAAFGRTHGHGRGMGGGTENPDLWQRIPSDTNVNTQRMGGQRVTTRTTRQQMPDGSQKVRTVRTVEHPDGSRREVQVHDSTEPAPARAPPRQHQEMGLADMVESELQSAMAGQMDKQEIGYAIQDAQTVAGNLHSSGQTAEAARVERMVRQLQEIHAHAPDPHARRFSGFTAQPDPFGDELYSRLTRSQPAASHRQEPESDEDAEFEAALRASLRESEAESQTWQQPAVPASNWSSQHIELNSMGFEDGDLRGKALEACDGDVAQAVDWLLALACNDP